MTYVMKCYWRQNIFLTPLQMFKFDLIVCQCLRSVYVNISNEVFLLLVIIEGCPFVSLLFFLS